MSVNTSTLDTPSEVESDNSRLRLVGAVALVVVVLDQLTKIWAVAGLDDGPIDLFWTLRFRLIYNTGASFSLGSGIGRWIGVVIFFVVIGVMVYARGVPGRVPRMLLGAIVGGAVGNLIDRIFRADDGFLSGGVVDFIDLQWWPVFNIADIAVVCGAIALMAYTLREDLQARPSADETDAETVEPGVAAQVSDDATDRVGDDDVNSTDDAS